MPRNLLHCHNWDGQEGTVTAGIRGQGMVTFFQCTRYPLVAKSSNSAAV